MICNSWKTLTGEDCLKRAHFSPVLVVLASATACGVYGVSLMMAMIRRL
jgi:hypothetical protein